MARPLVALDSALEIEKKWPRGTYKKTNGIDDRTILRSWLQGKLQVKFSEIKYFNLKDLMNIYNDVTNNHLDYLAEGLKNKKLDERKEPMETKLEAKVDEKISKKEVLDSPAERLAEAIRALQKQSLDEPTIRKIVEQEVQKIKPVEKILIIKDSKPQEKIDVGIQHKSFPLLLKILEAGLNVALVGPAGTGKTTAAEAAAKALGLSYECQSFSGTTTKADLLGFIDANGNYRDTPFRRAYVKGGLWVGDEFDAGNANANVVINAATANGLCAFPDGLQKHGPTFKAVICMNTYGSGATREYIGRNQLDAATLDRFAFLNWELDESLELAMVGMSIPHGDINIKSGGLITNSEWVGYVRKVRSVVSKLSVRHLVTPRAVLFGTRLFAVGVGRNHVENLVLWKGLDQEQVNRIKKEIK